MLPLGRAAVAGSFRSFKRSPRVALQPAWSAGCDRSVILNVAFCQRHRELCSNPGMEKFSPAKRLGKLRQNVWYVIVKSLEAWNSLKWNREYHPFWDSQNEGHELELRFIHRVPPRYFAGRSSVSCRAITSRCTSDPDSQICLRQNSSRTLSAQLLQTQRSIKKPRVG